MNKSLVALAASLVAATAMGAGTATLTWTAPTQNTNGTALTDLASYKIFEAPTCAGVNTGLTPVATVSAPATTKTLTGYADGSAVCFGVAAANAAGVLSALSNTALKTFPTPNIPNSPTNLIVSVQLVTAYKLRQSVDSYAMVPIGTVGLGTICNASRSVDGYNVVPRVTVKLASRYDTMPLVVFARCG